MDKDEELERKYVTDKEQQKASCNNQVEDCGWEGLYAEAKREEYRSSKESWLALAGREGYTYKCPNCGNTIGCIWTKMS